MLKDSFYKSATAIKLFFLLFILVNGSIAFSQGRLMDNWEEKLLKAKGQERIDFIVKLSKDLRFENFAMADSISREGITLAKEMGDSLSMHRIGANLGKLLSILNRADEGLEITKKSVEYFSRNKDLVFDKAKHQLTIAFSYMRTKEYTKADSLISDSEIYFKNANDLLWQSKVLGSRGLIYMYKYEYDKSLTYYSEALKIGEGLDDSENLAVFMRAVGDLKRYQGQYPEALELQFQALELNASTFSNAYCCQNISSLYTQLEDWQLATKYINKAIELKKKLGFEYGLAESYYSMGVIYEKQLNFGDALKYHNQSLNISRKYNIEKQISNALGALGNIYGELGESDRANSYYDEQLELAKKQNNWEGMYLVNYNKGYFLHKAKQYDEALKYLSKSHQMAEEEGNLPYLLKSCAMMANVHDALKQFEKSSFYADQYYAINDSINNAKKMREVGALEQKYQPELQKDSLNSANQNDTSINQEGKLFGKPTILAGLGLLVLLLGFSYWFYKKNRKKEVTSTKNKTSQETKIDRYFKELFARLDQNKIASESEALSSSNTNVNPIIDMSEFLKSNLSTPNEWTSFEHYFEKVHKDFFKNLKADCPTITTNEMNMCALLKLNLLNKDIAQILGISHDSVRKKQARLAKRITFSGNETLRDYILRT